MKRPKKNRNYRYLISRTDRYLEPRRVRGGYFDVAAFTVCQAALAALDELGWSVSAEPLPEDYDPED